MKPIEFSESRIVTEDIPYQVVDLKGSHADGGTLQLGRVVWVKRPLEGQSLEVHVSVYAEGVGVANVESAKLRLPV